MPSRSEQLLTGAGAFLPMFIFSPASDSLRAARRQADAWDRKVRSSFPVQSSGSIWALNKNPDDGYPTQGWKIHVSCTILNATAVLDAVAEILGAHRTVAKTVNRLADINVINSGLVYGYSQIGKIFTIYPVDSDTFVQLANDLAAALRGVEGPMVPFDFAVPGSRCVFYRFGSFDGTGSLTSPDGISVADNRNKCGTPSWVKDPLDARDDETGDANTFALTPVYDCLSQRGKGGVYMALDLRTENVRRVVIKEGRRNGEVHWDGTDGYRLIANEAAVLQDLAQGSVAIVPKPLGTVAIDRGFYLIEEFIEGTPLSALIANRVFASNRALRDKVIKSICRGLHQVHRNKVAWRDLKPQNIILRNGNATFLDFDIAVRVPARRRPDHRGTRGFVPPEAICSSSGKQLLAHDLYALGITIGLICGGRLVKDRLLFLKRRSSFDRRYETLVKKLTRRTAILRPNAGQIFRDVNRIQKPRRARPNCTMGGRQCRQYTYC